MISNLKKLEGADVITTGAGASFSANGWTLSAPTAGRRGHSRWTSRDPMTRRASWECAMRATSTQRFA